MQPNGQLIGASYLGTPQPDATCSGTGRLVQAQAQAHRQPSYFAHEDNVNMGVMAYDIVEFADDDEAATYRLAYDGGN